MLVHTLLTGDHDLEVLEALLGAAGVLVQQQPLVQQHRIDGCHVRLPPQPPAHVQQCLRQVMFLQWRRIHWRRTVSTDLDVVITSHATAHAVVYICLAHLLEVWCKHLEVQLFVMRIQLLCTKSNFAWVS